MNNPNDTRPDKKNERDPLIERAAALIEDDPLRGLAGNNAPPIGKTKPAEVSATVEEKGLAASNLANSQGNPASEETPHSDDAHEETDERAAVNGNGLIQMNGPQARSSRVFMPGIDQSRSIEEFRQIKRSVLHKLYSDTEPEAKNSNLILVTSSQPNEGKTFVSVNLAISMALEKDMRVLLIDVDQTNRGVRETLGISKGKRGLNDVIEDTSLNLADVILDTDIEGLSVIPAGTYHPLGAELLSSRRMTLILDELANSRHANVVIFDAPPVLATTEASILANQVGQIVFVVEADKTSQTTIADALEIIGPNENIGFVLNKTRVVVGDSQFGAYYSYGYGKHNAA